MAQLTVHRKGHKRDSYMKDVKPGPGKKMRRIKATRVKSVTFKTKDKGKPGRTPKDEQFYHPKVHMGWKKDMGMAERRRKALAAHKGDELSTARALQALSNVTTDRATQRAARQDALYFYAKHRGRG